ncbi:MAG: DUF4097 family beta strand repeat-containing protein, partial [Spirochaetota bacterium]
MKKIYIVRCVGWILSILLLDSCGTGGSGFRETRDLELPAASLEAFEIESLQGDLDITGDSTLDSIKVKAEIVVTNSDEEKAREDIAGGVSLALKKRGNRAVLTSIFNPGFFLFNVGTEKKIHLDIKSPEGIEIRVTGNGGDVHISDVKSNVRVEHKSGDTVIERMKGSLDLEDGSGEITIDGLEGSIKCNDLGGDIRISRVAGGLEITDTSGDVEIKNINGNVSIHYINGNITCEEIMGGVKIIGSGKGNVRL